jgi:hypothetical protein
MLLFNYKIDPMRLPVFVGPQLLSALPASPIDSEISGCCPGTPAEAGDHCP